MLRKSCTTLIIAIILLVISLPIITMHSSAGNTIYSILGWALAIFAGALFRELHYRQ